MIWGAKKGQCPSCGHIDNVYGFGLRRRIGQGTDPQGEPYIETEFDKFFIKVINEINGMKSAYDVRQFINVKYNIIMSPKKVERELSRLVGYEKIAAERDEHKLFYGSANRMEEED